ncbi:uncharacterized protein [Pempheris klunzingeri]|uniref:uncharacterized protein n=1 Tax=Pempheris klunzingeri TaxID=3127111 RepID=UPI00397F4BF3
MYRRRSPRLPNASEKSPQRSPSPDEEVIQRRLKGKRQRMGLRRKARDGVVNTRKGRSRDIIDIINCTHGAERAAAEGEGTFVEVADEGVDGSDEDCCSVSSSIASGPSILCNATPRKARPSQSLCSDCRKLCQKVKRMKAPASKLSDNDPKSLTCDQWVLIKSWRPRRLSDARGKLLTHIQLVKKGLARRAEQYMREGASSSSSSACSRPHAFLQRNLRQCIRVPVKKERKKSRRKRRREDSQGPRAAKQQRLHGNNRRHRISVSRDDNDGPHPSSSHSGSLSFDDSADTQLSVESIPSSVTVETSQPREGPPKQKAPKRTGGFRDLLAQLRGNCSMIVSEKR